MNKILVLIVVLAGVGMLVEFMKRSKKTPTSSLDDDQRMRTAAEEGPTETGRFRVQEMLRNTEAPEEEPKKQAAQTTAAPEEEELPDPFDRD